LGVRAPIENADGAIGAPPRTAIAVSFAPPRAEAGGAIPIGIVADLGAGDTLAESRGGAAGTGTAGASGAVGAAGVTAAGGVVGIRLGL
jgi:hypothetical protein